MVSARSVAVFCVATIGVVLLSLTITSIVGGSAIQASPATEMWGGTAQRGMYSPSYAGRAMAPESKMMMASDSAYSDGGFGGGDGNAVVVHSADLSLGVVDIMQASRAATDHVNEIGGFVVRSNSYANTAAGNVQQLSMTVRVPADTFDATVEKLRQLAKVVYSQVVDGMDVTAQVVDIESQIHTLEAVNARLLELLGRAESVSDAVAVQREMMPVSEQLDRLKGRLDYMRQSARLSRITITFSQYESPPDNVVGGFHPLRAFVRALRALFMAVGVLLEALIYAIVFTTPVAALLFGAYWVYKNRTQVSIAAQ